jgi:hypothetical protein
MRHVLYYRLVDLSPEAPSGRHWLRLAAWQLNQTRDRSLGWQKYRFLGRREFELQLMRAGERIKADSF